MKQTTIRIRERTRNEIAEIAAQQRRDFDSVANDWTPERVWERYPFMKPPGT